MTERQLAERYGVPVGIVRRWRANGLSTAGLGVADPPRFDLDVTGLWLEEREAAGHVERIPEPTVQSGQTVGVSTLHDSE